MKILKSKRFWVNLVTTLTMVLSLGNVMELSETQAEYLTLSVAVGNIILQVWFNQDKKSSV